MLCCLNPDCQKPLNQDIDKFCQSCGAELITLLRHRYKITKPLGQGGFGKTYLAEDTDKLKRPCVVKQLFYQGQSSNANQKIVELFMREAEQLDQLKANQQIPDLLAYFEDNGFLYLVQEYVDGQDLLKELQKKGPFSEAKVEALLRDLLPVLAFIHKKGVVHRDLKPENIMRRREDGRLMLIDFGVARQISMSQLTTTGTKVGSPGYFAVEQFAEGKATASSDLYSIGATAFHLLTGQYPGNLWTMEGYGWVNSWQDHLSHTINTKLVAILDKLLQIRAEDRYQSADEVLVNLDQAEIQRQAEAQQQAHLRQDTKARHQERKKIKASSITATPNAKVYVPTTNIDSDVENKLPQQTSRQRLQLKYSRWYFATGSVVLVLFALFGIISRFSRQEEPVPGAGNSTSEPSASVSPDPNPSPASPSASQTAPVSSPIVSPTPSPTLSASDEVTVASARKIIQSWQTAKAEAMSKDHQIASLDKILVEPSLSEWKAGALSDQANQIYIEYTLDDLKINAIQQQSPTQATVEATVTETAKVFEGGQQTTNGYTSDTYRLRYELVREQDQWKIQQIQVLN